jgi:hypothetical protein
VEAFWLTSQLTFNFPAASPGKFNRQERKQRGEEKKDIKAALLRAPGISWCSQHRYPSISLASARIFGGQLPASPFRVFGVFRGFNSPAFFV